MSSNHIELTLTIGWDTMSSLTNGANEMNLQPGSSAANGKDVCVFLIAGTHPSRS